MSSFFLLRNDTNNTNNEINQTLILDYSGPIPAIITENASLVVVPSSVVIRVPVVPVTVVVSAATAHH